MSFAGGASDVYSVASIRGDKAMLVHTFPTRPELRASRPRLYFNTGVGVDNDSTVYLNRTAPLWDNQLNDCARIVFANNRQLVFNLGNGCTTP